jgi:glycosyltransferase involved in cell wall biosynthesis
LAVLLPLEGGDEHGNGLRLGLRRLEEGSKELLGHLNGKSGPDSVTVVIPTKNEARNIAWVLEQIPAWVDEIVLVDGHSTDGTVEAAIRVRPDVVVVHQEPLGKGAALQAGFATATGDIIVMLDADGSMHPREIGRYVALLASGYDLVKGSRFMAGAASTDITLLRQLGNGVLLRLTNLLYGTRFTDLCYGYCAFRRNVLGKLQLTATGFEVEAQLIVRACLAGLAITEVPSHESTRRYGQSNLRTFRDGQRVLWTLLKETFSSDAFRPQRTAASILPTPVFDLAQDPEIGSTR